jgi:hypothetical protein
MYYASEWDDEKVAAVIEELKDPENVELFNSLALCVIQGAYCDLVPDISTEDQIWAAMVRSAVIAGISCCVLSVAYV